MPIRVKTKDGKVYSLEELIPISRNLSNKIKVGRHYFRVDKNIRKNYAILLETDSEFLISFSDDEPKDLFILSNVCMDKFSWYKKTLNGHYSTTHLRSKIGKGIFELEKLEDNLYRILNHKK